MTQSFATPGTAVARFVVPAGVCGYDVLADGGQGGAGSNGTGGAGGNGARVTSTITVAPGDAIVVDVGGNGAPGAAGGAGGVNGGGAGTSN